MFSDTLLASAQRTTVGLPVSGTTFLLIVLAEIGDKSQLVCMTLAARHRALPVLTGMIAAFVLLNLLAVVFGSAVAAWIPGWMITLIVAILFAVFGIQSLHCVKQKGDEEVSAKDRQGVIVTTFILIFVAELGDKTQLAVAAMSSTYDPVSVWLGGTFALVFVSALGVIAGRTILSRIPQSTLHRVGGIFFLVLAALSLIKVIENLPT